MLQMKVFALLVHPIQNIPIVILKEINGDQTLPIWIGFNEAAAITNEFEGKKLSRPLAHDLLKNVMEEVKAKIDKVEIYDLKDNTFYAYIYFTYNDQQMSVDARPSDALALALRAQAPIFVAEKVFESLQKDKETPSKEWKEILEKFTPEDFGKFKH